MAALLASLLSAGAGYGPEIDAADPRLQRQGARLLLAGQPMEGVLVRRDARGAVLARQPYREGLLDGLEREWYANGQARSARRYQSGRKVGRHLGWWPDGWPRFVYEFAAGEFHGEVLSWFESGRLAEERHYEHGHEAGLQRTWYADGAPRASYWYRDGRRYGTIGAKLCLTDEERHAALKRSRS